MTCKHFDYFVWVEATKVEKPLYVKINVKLADLDEVVKEIRIVFIHEKELIAVKTASYTR
jgi:hypothetical protein